MVRNIKYKFIIMERVTKIIKIVFFKPLWSVNPDIANGTKTWE